MNWIINTGLQMIARFFKWFWRNRRYTIPALLIAAVGFFGFCAYRDSQKEVQREREARSAEHRIEIDESRREVNAAANSANQALGNVANVENGNFQNTNLKRAEDLRCKVFPNSKGC